MDGKDKFHYSWILILISFIIWSDPPDYQPQDIHLLCHDVKYQNLWENKEDKIQENEKIELFLHTEVL